MGERLAGRVVWITGASEGIGAAIARAAAGAGARVAVSARSEDKLSDLASQLPGESLIVPVDVTDESAVAAAVERIWEKWQRLDGVVANAGTNGTWAPIDKLSRDEWEQPLAVNLTGSFLTLHYAIPKLRATGAGSVVLVSSVNGTRVFSNEGASAYASSKAAQLAFGQMAALELAPDKIRVNIICPGAIATRIHEKTEQEDLEEVEIPVEFPHGRIPLTGGKMGKAEDVAEVVLFLLSDASRHVTGTPLWIDGAESLLQG